MAIPKALQYLSPALAIIGAFQKRGKQGGGSSGGGTNTDDPGAPGQSFKRGGKVKKTGRAKVHKGERVLTAKQSRKYGRRKRAGGKR